jgi:hypothetical protein
MTRSTKVSKATGRPVRVTDGHELLLIRSPRVFGCTCGHVYMAGSRRSAESTHYGHLKALEDSAEERRQVHLSGDPAQWT